MQQNSPYLSSTAVCRRVGLAPSLGSSAVDLTLGVGLVGDMVLDMGISVGKPALSLVSCVMSLTRETFPPLAIMSRRTVSVAVMKTVALSHSLTSCSTWEIRPCTLSSPHSIVDSTVGV